MMKKRKMKILITTDTKLLHTRLLTILSGISRLGIVGEARTVEKALELNSKFSPDVLLFSFYNFDNSAFQKLAEIKKEKDRPVIIVLTSSPCSENIIKWTNAGADYTFDLAFQFTEMVDVVGELMDKGLYGLKQIPNKI